MAIQPLAIVAAQGRCAQGSRNGSCCDAKTVCTTCKCCDVEKDGDLCGCCSGSEDDTGGCCTKMAGKPKVDELFGEISDVVPEPPKSIDGALTQEAAALPSCLCGVHSEPVAPLPHRVPVPQSRSFVVIASLDHVASDTSLAVRSKPATSRLPIGDLSPHFSQRFLCIWRI
jgi:hypothetical protein